MERRLLLAIFLTFIVLTAYQWLIPKPPPQASKPAAVPAATTPDTPAAPPPAAVVAESLPDVDTVVAAAAQKDVVVDNGVVRAVFSNRGAVLTRWELLKYQDASGQPVDLVPHDLPADALRPLSLELEDPAQTRRVNHALYAPSADGPLDATANPVTLTFEYQDAAGLQVRKQFRLEPNSYVVTLAVEASSGDRRLNPAVAFGPALGDVAPLAPGGRSVRRAEAIQSAGGKVQRVAASSLATTPRHEGTYEFVGVDTHYFLAAAVRPGAAVVEYRPVSVPSGTAASPVSRDYVAFDIRFPQPPSAVRFYVGPKELRALEAVDPQMVRAIWFGMFAFLSVPLLSALNWIDGFVGNYGWSILVLTVLINAVMFPLRHKSFVSMRKMQEIQPQVKAIQDRYSKLKVTDPARQKMNTELMDLYRSKGVNPASGCIPMVLTFPVLFAFYGLLSEAIELRGAPFMLWIKDLSAADPYYVTPILMGASQLVQQRMAPTGADPTQQRMMLIMPVVFTFMFISAPSGLALYWLASNVLLIGQQALTNHLIGPPDVRVPRPPAERRLKKIGESKTAPAGEPEPRSQS